MIGYKEFSVEKIEEVKEIYASEGWSAYLKDDGKLIKAFENSMFILGAFDGENLIGFIRCLGDGEHFVIVQDLIVHKEYQRQGIGSTLFQTAEKKYESVRMFHVITDLTDERNHAFYKKMGMKTLEEGNMISYFR